MRFRDFQKEFAPLQLEIEDPDEIDRLEHIAACVPRPDRLLLAQPDTSQSESSWEGRAEEEEGKG
jgi:hypothetical protein